MKNQVHFLTLVLVVCFFTLNSLVLAQENESHLFIVTTYKTMIPEGGSAAERDSLIALWVEAVQNKNDKILSSKTLRHYYGNNSEDWVVIDEYKTWADIEEAKEINKALNKEKWPDDEERAEFFRKIWKYFSTHSDEIYSELPELGK